MRVITRDSAGPPKRKPSDAKVEEELERVDVEENKEKHEAGEETDCAVIKPVTAAEFVVAVPKKREKEKAKSERGKAAHCCDKIGKRLRHIERDHEQCEREPEDSIAERFEPCDLAPAQTKSNRVRGFGGGLATNHLQFIIRCGRTGQDVITLAGG